MPAAEHNVSIVNKHRIFLVVEAIIILLPVSVLAIFGFIYILSLHLGENMFFTPIPAVIGISIASMAILGLCSLWYGVLSQIREKFNKAKISSNLYFTAHLGAFIASISLVSWLVMVIEPDTKIYVSYFSIYVFGVPALIPYIHIMYIQKKC